MYKKLTMAAAIYIKTESGDSYVYAFDGQPTKEEIIKSLKEKMGEEYDYISNYEMDFTYEIKKFKIK